MSITFLEWNDASDAERFAAYFALAAELAACRERLAEAEQKLTAWEWLAKAEQMDESRLTDAPSRECLAAAHFSIHGISVDYFQCPKCAALAPPASEP